MFLLAGLLPLFLFSCCLGKKFKTQIETVTITKIDTIIKFVPDTIEKIKRVEIHDTAFIENEIAAARSYFDTKTQKIVLSLKGKIIDVPVQIDQIIKTKEQSIERENCIKLSSVIIFIIGAMFFIVLFSIAFSYIKKKFNL
ncbi:MAG: hypothetical protein GYA62_05190 [Bacteroidales bacterium]|nr:hypothetical protein [Bacteroidales bacterium]